VGLLISMMSAGFVSHPVPAAAAAIDVAAVTHVVYFDSQGSQTQHVTAAQTVADFLKERGITPSAGDLVRPDPGTPLANNLIIQYSRAVPVAIVTAAGRRSVMTTASDVGALLEEQHITLERHDVVTPSLGDPLPINGTVRIARIEQWAVAEKHHTRGKTIRKIDFSLPPGTTRVLNKGQAGLTVTMVRYTKTDGMLRKLVVGHSTVRKPHDRIIAEGVGTAQAIAELARHGLQKASYIASSALDMLATAYTAACSGCTGYTASGYRAGHGIVAVDPRVIPLGTRLYIPGYGFAIAGDTGGAITGNRIDLGFDSIGDALSFGRRAIKVYRLH
jgi:3D (Asp-Asp-Asp) domain-containing protein